MTAKRHKKLFMAMGIPRNFAEKLSKAPINRLLSRKENWDNFCKVLYELWKEADEPLETAEREKGAKAVESE